MPNGKNYVNYLTVSTLLRIRYCIKIGYSVDELAEDFNITRFSALKLYTKYKGTEYNRPRLGGKDEPYYEGDDNSIPEYKLDDLTGIEKCIAEQNINPGKLWTWEE